MRTGQLKQEMLGAFKGEEMRREPRRIEEVSAGRTAQKVWAGSVNPEDVRTGTEQEIVNRWGAGLLGIHDVPN